MLHKLVLISKCLQQIQSEQTIIESQLPCLRLDLGTRTRHTCCILLQYSLRQVQKQFYQYTEQLCYPEIPQASLRPVLNWIKFGHDIIALKLQLCLLVKHIYLPPVIRAAKMIAPSRIPNTLSIRNPKIINVNIKELLLWMLWI